MTERPYTTAQLAERWQCCERHIRNMIDAGELEAFQIGRLWRIPAAVVREREEQCQRSGSSDTEASGQQRGRKAAERSGARSAPVIVPLPSRF